VDYLLYWFSHNLGYKVTYLVASLIPLSILAILLKAYIIPPKVENLLIFILSIIGSLLLYFLIYYLIALVSFWLIDISAFFFTANIVLELLSGTLIPLNFLPEYLQKTLEFLPFSYLIYFPLNIYLGRISNNDVYMGLATQIIWIVFFGIIARLTWKKGLRKYEAIGS
ncbi:ABC-2 family transporter protein, partial [Priestia aryabhattai]|uniref:ABC transporter permease n=1 Tax=Priestia aryabhattai TaxID=412384 RepID=UPI002E23A58C|nr:ABC-2 family transporter protein [Priestia aryabhattai]